MPTVGWIQETVDDRFYEGREHIAAPRPPVFPCVICGAEFDSTDERSWHVNEVHPLARPMLVVRGLPAPALSIVRIPIGRNDLFVENATDVRVLIDGKPVDGLVPAGLGALVATERAARFTIELENERAEDSADVVARYEIDVAIPDPRDLEAVDQAFVGRLAIDRPSTKQIDDFASDVASFTSARAYAGALADYVHGVLAKDGSESGGTTLPFEAFQSKFARALAELSDHVDRPVAAAVVGVAKLNLNDVKGEPPKTGDPRLDGSLRVLSAASRLETVVVKPAGEGATVPLCPVDRATDVVLNAYEELLDPGDASTSNAAERAEDPTLSPQDRAKLRVFRVIGATGAGRRDLAAPDLEALRHDAVFGRWAEHELERAA